MQTLTGKNLPGEIIFTDLKVITVDILSLYFDPQACVRNIRVNLCEQAIYNIPIEHALCK